MTVGKQPSLRGEGGPGGGGGEGCRGGERSGARERPDKDDPEGGGALHAPASTGCLIP